MQEPDRFDSAVARARTYLPASRELEEYVSEGEWGLVLYVLEAMARESRAPAECWDAIFEAAHDLGAPREALTVDGIRKWIEHININ